MPSWSPKKYVRIKISEIHFIKKLNPWYDINYNKILAWRSATVRFDLNGDLVWYNMDNFHGAGSSLIKFINFNRYKRGLETCPKANFAKSGREYFLLFFSAASERRVWLSAESKILASTFGRFRLYRLMGRLLTYFSTIVATSWFLRSAFVKPQAVES